MVGLPKSIIKKYGITKKAWSVFRHKKRSSRVTSFHSPKKKTYGGLRSMAKKHHSRRGGSLLQSGEKLAKAGAFLAPAIGHLLSVGTPRQKFGWITRDYTSWNWETDKVEPHFLVRGWGPVVVVSVASVVVHKIIGLIRRV